MAKRRSNRSLRTAFVGTEQKDHSNTASQETVNTETSEESEMVPGGRNGELVPAEKPVNMTFTVTAKERYLWNLELKRRGRTGVSVLREAMEEISANED